MAGDPQILTATIDLIQRIELIWQDAPPVFERITFIQGQDYQGADLERAVFRTGDQYSREYSLSYIDESGTFHQLTILDPRFITFLDRVPYEGCFNTIYRTGDPKDPQIKEIEPLGSVAFYKRHLLPSEKPKFGPMLDSAVQMPYSRVEEFIQKYDPLLPKLVK